MVLPRVLSGRLRKSLLSINPVDRPCEPRRDENRVSDGSKGGKKNSNNYVHHKCEPKTPNLGLNRKVESSAGYYLLEYFLAPRRLSSGPSLRLLGKCSTTDPISSP